MSTQSVNAKIHEQALRLARDARLVDPSIIKFYWFPDDEEVRLIEISTDMQPSMSDEVQPFYFPPDPQYQMPALSGVALILENEEGKLTLPEGWGTWSDGQVLDLEDPE